MGTINPRETLPLRLRADHVLNLTGVGEISSQKRSFKLNGTLTVGPYEDDVSLFITASPETAGVQYLLQSIYGYIGGQVVSPLSNAIALDGLALTLDGLAMELTQ